MMKKLFFASLTMIFCLSVSAQKISRITITRDGDIEMISFGLDDNITLNLSKDGNVIAWGVEVFSDRIPNYSKLDTYPGRVEYYSDKDNEAFRGKVKYIGRTLITYYASFDNEAFRGKVKTIGSNTLEYYGLADNEATKGKIKSFGSTAFGWYTTFDNEAFKGKLRTVGNTTLSYYGSFDDKAIKGKIKSIDRATFTYYTSNERNDYKGALKSGSQQQTINGIKYYIKF